MKTTLTYDNQYLQLHGALHTASEINQQPKIWQQLTDALKLQKAAIDAFLAPVLESTPPNQQNLNIILTGAGTSAYVGQTIAAYLNSNLNSNTPTTANITAIATTDIVSNPELYLPKTTPTLLVSFARSGNSPESIACVELTNQCIDTVYHLIITCNEQGSLHQLSRLSSSDSHLNPNSNLNPDSNSKLQNSLSVLMPKDSNDKSFAMTSSFTVMTLAALSIFTHQTPLNDITHVCEQILQNEQLETIKTLAQVDFNKVVFIGSGPLAAIAQEASLKMLELTKGQVNSYFETVLGFRHGPKSVIDDKTLVIILNSQQTYQQQYESDLFKELKTEQQSQFVYTMNNLLPNKPTNLQDVWLSFPYIVYCQALAFYKALALGITPDNPCPTGEVNRVVQGVSIYPFKAKH